MAGPPRGRSPAGWPESLAGWLTGWLAGGTGQRLHLIPRVEQCLQHGWLAWDGCVYLQAWLCNAPRMWEKACCWECRQVGGKACGWGKNVLGGEKLGKARRQTTPGRGGGRGGLNTTTQPTAPLHRVH